MEKKVQPRLTVIIIARNEERTLADCLKSVRWADEVVVIDTGSTDATGQIAKEFGARVVAAPFEKLTFAAWRNLGLKEAMGDWILYLDADERVTPLSRQEMVKIIKASPTPDEPVAFAIPRRNFYFGREMKHGGAWPDYVKRLFWKKSLKGWRGKLHEEPEYTGRMQKLAEPLIHLTHRELTSMLTKSIGWAALEAELLDQAGHPPVVAWRIFRMMGTKFWERMIWQGAWKDGAEGWLNALFEVFNTFIIYVLLWERQQTSRTKRPGA